MSAELAPYVRFFHRRRDLARDARVVADAAVLRSFASMAFAPAETARLTGAVEDKLILNRAAFQILHEHQLPEARAYPVLVLAGCTALSNGSIDAVRRYVCGGGRLCVVGPLATHDEWMIARPKPALDDLPASAVLRIASAGDVLPAIRRLHNGRLSVTVSAPVAAAAELPARIAVGQAIYDDRPFTITAVPEELLGLPTLRTSHAAAKRDALVRLHANVPVRVFAAFAPKGFSDLWLDPPPGWTLYRKAGLVSTITQIGRGMDIYYRDFEAGEIKLFAGRKGNFALLGIKSMATGPKGVTIAVGEKPDAPPGLCLELTDQAARRMVHLVNYRQDGPVTQIAVKVRVPAGKKVTSVALASPEHEKDLTCQFQQQGDEVSFTVPGVGIYEIAVVSWYP
jgi:hypothetical protein